MATKIADDFQHGKNFKCGENVIIYPDVIVGDNVTLANNVVLKSGTRFGNDIEFDDFCMTSGPVLLGDRISVKAYAGLARGTIVEDDVFFGGGSYTNHAIHVAHRRPNMKPQSFVTRIGAGAIIGTRCFIAPACHLAPLTVLGSNTNVYKPITEPGIYLGSPAKKVRDLPPEYLMPVSPRRLKFPPDVVEKYLKNYVGIDTV